MSYVRSSLSSHKHVLVSATFLFLSCTLSYVAWKQSPQASQVLGSQTLIAQDALQVQPQHVGGETPTDDQTVLQQIIPQETQPSQETTQPSQGQDTTSQTSPENIPTETPTTDIVVTDPTIEIEIDNTDTTLVITDASSDTPIVRVPTDPTISYDEGGGVLLPTTPTTGSETPSLGTPTRPTDTYPTIESSVPGIITTIRTTPNTSSSIDSSPFTLSKVKMAMSKPLSYIGIDVSKSEIVPPGASAVSISYRPTAGGIDLDSLLRDYQFQVWAVGDSTIALYRNGITTYTTHAIKLGLSKLTFKLVTDKGDMPVIYYPDTVWSYLADIREISRDTHTQPIELMSDNGSLTYHITAHSRKMLFAALPVKVCRNLVVSVESRHIESSAPCTQWDKMLDSISLAL